MSDLERYQGINPLDEYLQDVEAESKELYAFKDDPRFSSVSSFDKQDDDWGDETLVNPLITPPKGWTGSQRNTPGPSTPTRHPIARQDMVDETGIQAFAERFKYLVCSSGLLEKDFGSSTLEETGNGESDEEELGRPKEQVEPIAQNSRSSSSLQAIQERLQDIRLIVSTLQWVHWAEKGFERWDIVLAAVVLLGAVMVILGIRRILVSLGCVALGVILAEFWPWRALPGSDPDPVEAKLATPMSPSITPCSSPSPRSQAFLALSSLLSASWDLDTVLTRSLSLLSTHHSISDPLLLKPLQTALHRLCGEMTDHVASASSGLLPLVYMTEVRTLGAMYDVPVLGERRTRISDLTESSGRSSVEGRDEQMQYQERFGGLDHVGAGGVPSPKRPLPPSTIRPDRTRLFPAIDNNDNLQAQMMSTTRSLPSRLNRHTHHLSLLPSPRPLRLLDPPVSASIADDHFTSIPRRTLRLTKRASWDASNARQQSVVGRIKDGTEDKKRRWSRGDAAGGLLTAWTFREGSEGKVKRSHSGRRVVHEKRITEADEEEGAGSVIKGFSEAQKKERIQPGERDISSSGEAWTSESDLSTGESSIPIRPSTPSATSGLRSFALSHSPPARTHTPKRTSPLTGRHLSTPVRSLPIRHSLTESAIRLANLSSPPLKPNRLSLNISPPTENPKRRSLQNMPYYPSLPPSSPLGIGLSRTRSLQSHSDLQAVRARSATGSTTHSRRTSSVSMQSVMSHRSISLHPYPTATDPPPGATLTANRQPHRIPSLSPFTIPALKAACLGVHLKRRRVACCLLALKWEETDADYWKNVGDVLDTLRMAMEAEKDGLEVVRRQVETALAAQPQTEDKGRSEDREMMLTPPWKGSYNTQHGRPDFAPIRSEQQKMLEHVNIVQRALERAWAETAMVRRRLTEDEGEIMEGVKRGWGGLRAELGIMVREVERGKETIRTLDSSAIDPVNTSSTDDPDTSSTSAPPPDFLKIWEDDFDAVTTRSTSIGTAPTDIISSPHPTEDLVGVMPEVLVPAGRDEVYEVDIGPALPQDHGLGKMQREERVRLMKLARAEGLTLGEYMRRKAGEGVEDAGWSKEERRRDEGGRLVVDELKGIIGIIKDKKDRAAKSSQTQA